jgi:hydroxypyruvate reductase/glycerate 2-kinase
LVIGSNSLCLETAKEKALELGFNAHILTSSLEGDISRVADFITGEIKKTIRSCAKRPVCLLLGGEPTLKVNRRGKGGRNQHLALIMAKKLKDIKGVTFLSAGTDGTDGPTDAAGAITDSVTMTKAIKDGIDLDQYLSNFDSYHFFKKTGGHLIIGPTQTNVMDLMIAVIE